MMTTQGEGGRSTRKHRASTESTHLQENTNLIFTEHCFRHWARHFHAYLLENQIEKVSI